MTEENTTTEEIEETFPCATCSHPTTDDDRYSCDQCSDILCSDCGQWIEAEERTICSSCYERSYTECSDCGHTMRRSDGISTSHYAEICSRCYENNYITCESCDAVVHSDSASYCDQCNESLCTSCYEEDHNHKESLCLFEHSQDLLRNGSRAIADYDHKETDWRKLASKTDLFSDPYFGIELEIGTVFEATDDRESVCCTKDAVKLCAKHLENRILCAHDGSVSNGFELILTPHKIQEYSSLNMRNLLKQLATLGARSYDHGNCGLHVHIERKGILNKDFGYRNGTYKYGSDLYQEFFQLVQDDLTVFSKRKAEKIDQYCKFQLCKYARYSAVNLSNDDTIEIRIFRGTLNHARVKASILISLAVFDFLSYLPQSKMSIFTRTAKNPYIGICVRQAFREYLKRADQYQYLVKYLTKTRLFGF